VPGETITRNDVSRNSTLIVSTYRQIE
jgi:hypothetical protein